MSDKFTRIRGNQLPTEGQVTLFRDAGLMVKCIHRTYARWDCAVKVDGRVCRNRHNGTRSETKDGRNMADHIIRQHGDDPRVDAVVVAAFALHGNS